MLLQGFIVLLLSRLSLSYESLSNSCSIQSLQDSLDRTEDMELDYDFVGSINMILDITNMNDTNTVLVERLDYYGLIGDGRESYKKYTLNMSLSIKKVYVQHIVDYIYPTKTQEELKKYCVINFIEDYDIELDELPLRGYTALEYAKLCIENVLCDLNNRNQHLKSRSTKGPVRVTNQDSINAVFDITLNKIIAFMYEEDMLVTPIPYGEFVVEKGWFKISNTVLIISSGTADVINHLYRLGDLSIASDGSQHKISLKLEATGGSVKFYNISISKFRIPGVTGNLSISLKKSTLAVTITVDANKPTCGISADVQVFIPENNINYNDLHHWSNTDILKGLKYTQTTAAEKIRKEIEALMKKIIEQINCK